MEVKPVLIVGILLAVIVLVLGGKIGSSNSSNSLPGNGEYDEFAKCLSSNGVKMYGSHLCSHCNNQKALFGASWKFVNYVECATPEGQGACSGAGIRAYPTWVFGDGTRVEGEQSIKQLGAKSGCNAQ